MPPPPSSFTPPSSSASPSPSASAPSSSTFTSSGASSRKRPSACTSHGATSRPPTTTTRARRGARRSATSKPRRTPSASASAVQNPSSKYWRTGDRRGTLSLSEQPMNEIDARLGPCPWCQSMMCVGKAYPGSWVVSCTMCDATGPERPDPSAAADAWLSVFPRLGLPVDPPEGHVRVRLLVWTDGEGAARVELLDGTGKPSPYARPSVVAADVPLQTVYPVVGVKL